jgi:hypothetical protein
VFMSFYSLAPGFFCFNCTRVPGRVWVNKGGTAALFPAPVIAGGEGLGAEVQEELRGYLLVARIRVGAVGDGGAMASGGRRWLCSPAAMLR